MAADGDGDFAVVWASFFQDGSIFASFARRFSSAGAPLAAEFQANTYTTGDQTEPSVAAVANGDFVVAWLSNGRDSFIDGNGSTDALTDGLLVLRYLFGFTGATLVTGAVDAVGCTRCGRPEIEAYLGSLI